jgi:hypothetical protein
MLSGPHNNNPWSGRCKLRLPSMVAVWEMGRAAMRDWSRSTRTASNEIASARTFFP